MKGEIYDKKEIYDQLNKDVYFKDGGSMNLASLAGSIEKIRSKSKSSGSGSGDGDSSNTTKRFETEYIKGEDEVEENGNFVTVYLGGLFPDFDRFYVNNEPSYQAGDVIDVPYKEIDITNIMFNRSGTTNWTSVPTSIWYNLPDSQYFKSGDSHYGFRYERIGDEPSTATSMLLLYKEWSSEDPAPSGPIYLFRTIEISESEDSETTRFVIKAMYGDLQGEATTLNPNKDEIAFFNKDDTDRYFNAIEVCPGPNNTFIPKTSSDGIQSILDYFKFYYYAPGKTYVASRSGDYARPVDISRDVIEDLREKVLELEDKVPTILVGNIDYNSDDYAILNYMHMPAIIYRNVPGSSAEFNVKLSTGQSVTWKFIGLYSRNNSLDNSGTVLSYCQFFVPGTEGYLDTVTGQNAYFEMATKSVTEEKTTMFYLCAVDNNEIPIAVLPIIVTALPVNDQ